MVIAVKQNTQIDTGKENALFERLVIPAKIIRAAKIFQAKKDVRYYLNGLHFDPRGYVEATNGHVAIRIECEQCKQLSKKMILDIKGAKIPAKSDELEFVSMSDKRGVVLMRDGALKDLDEVRSFEVIDGVFPDVDRVIPKTDLEKIDHIGINAEYLKDIAEAQKILSQKHGGITLKFRGEMEKIEVEFHSIDIKATVILMPMSIS